MTSTRHDREEDLSEREIVSARTFGAPRDRVFEAFTDPVRLARWWGPKGFTSTIHELDLRPGGAWRFTMHAPGGVDHANESVFVEVVRPERIVFRHVSAEHPYEMTITLEADGGGTRVTWRMRHATAAECAKVKPFVVVGNEQNFDRLAAELAGHALAQGSTGAKPLAGKVALVAGATRGAGRGIAVELGAAGATVYVTGRSTRGRRSEYDRPETIEETAALVNEAGGDGIAVPTDHLEPARVAALVERIRREKGVLDVLVNDIWGGENLVEWNKPIWEHSLEKGLRLLRLAIDTHLVTSHHALPLLIARPGGLLVEVTDGTDEYNRTHYRLSAFYDLAKTSVTRLAWSLAQELAAHGGTAVAITPGWMRSEMMLGHYDVTEANWRDAHEEAAALRDLRDAAVRRTRGRSARRRPAEGALSTGSRSRAAGSRASTASPISTARVQTPSAISWRCRRPGSRRTSPATDDPDRRSEPAAESLRERSRNPRLPRLDERRQLPEVERLEVEQEVDVHVALLPGQFAETLCQCDGIELTRIARAHDWTRITGI